jgi:hypothetical protein
MYVKVSCKLQSKAKWSRRESSEQTLLYVRFILSKQQGSKGLFSKWQWNGWLAFWREK